MTKGTRPFKTATAAVFGLAVSLFISSAAQASDTTQICDRAAFVASQATGVPLDVLRAITRTETGRKRDGRIQPWPWTVNMEGAGRWFDTRAAALEFAKAHHARGARSYDIGCFQINYRWHGKAFASIDVMFDPNANALYAAQFLQDLFTEFGDWTVAAGAYHSRTPKYAKRYRERFARLRQDLSPPVIEVVEVVEPTPAEPAVNAFPLLLRTSTPGALASLVPLETGGGARLIDVSGQ